VLVSLISSKVGATLTVELTGAGVPEAMADRLGEAKDAVAMGVAPVSGDMPDRTKAGTVRATVESGNNASLATIAGFGFTRVGERGNEHDGLKILFELPAGAIQAE